MNVLVSVVVNCFNGERFLDNALKSIALQSYRNFEVIFYDNYSTDNSVSIFSNYSLVDNRFKLFRGAKHTSLGEARKLAVDFCIGEYLAFLDVDDIWLPNKLQVQLSLMISNSADISYTSYFEKDLDSDESHFRKINVQTTVDYFKLNLHKFQVCLPTLMCRREFLVANKINFDKNLMVSEEFCLVLCSIAAGAKVFVLDNFYSCFYTVRSNSLSVTGMKFWSIDRLYTVNYLKENYKNFTHCYEDALNKAINRSFYYDFLYNFINRDYGYSFASISKIRYNNLIYFLLYIIMLSKNYHVLNAVIKWKYGKRFLNK